MTRKEMRIGILKIGCIASSSYIDMILDERADRNIVTRSWSSGAKMDKDSADEITEMLLRYAPDLAIVVSPNASLPGPSKAREKLEGAAIPFISISDGPSQKAFFQKGQDGKKKVVAADNEGFIVVPSDPMIGARREFLDSTEMVLFNADVLKVLSICGVIRALHCMIDGLIKQVANGTALEMPRLVLDTDIAIEHAHFANPHAQGKAIAALKIIEESASVTSEACFKEQDPSRYIVLAAAGHEMVRAAARLADEVRELEKGADSVHRSPHSKDGLILTKSKLGEKPK